MMEKNKYALKYYFIKIKHIKMQSYLFLSNNSSNKIWVHMMLHIQNKGDEYTSKDVHNITHPGMRVEGFQINIDIPGIVHIIKYYLLLLQVM